MPIIFDGTDTIGDLGDALAAKSPSASPTFTGNVVWSAAALRTATASVATNETLDSRTYTDLATAGPAVTLVTGTKALVIVRCGFYNQSGRPGSWASFAVSGASTVAASDANAVYTYADAPAIATNNSTATLLTGLTAGTNTFTMKYKCDTWVTTFNRRSIIVMDMGS